MKITRVQVVVGTTKTFEINGTELLTIIRNSIPSNEYLADSRIEVYINNTSYAQRYEITSEDIITIILTKEITEVK